LRWFRHEPLVPCSGNCRESEVLRRSLRNGSQAQEETMAVLSFSAVSGLDASRQPSLMQQYRLLTLEVVE
jgi:hypothetical protein